MSRYIKSAETLKARVGKQVKVDGALCDVTERRGSIVFEGVDGGYHAEVNDIEAFLSDHDVATAGYKFKHTSSSRYILDEECRITLKPYVGDFDNTSIFHTIIGMITRCRDTRGDLGYMLLTNDEHLRGDPAKDKKGYANSWWLGFKEEALQNDVECTEPLVKPSSEFTNDVSKIPLNKPVKVQFKMYPGETYEGMFKRCHKLDDGKERIFFLSNHTCFDGCECVTSEREGYKYSWSMTSTTRSTTTTYEFKIVGDSEAPKKIPLEKLEEKEYSLLKLMGDESTRKTVKGAVKEIRGISYLLSNDDAFDGNHPDAVKGTDYEYGWWLCEGSDISKSDYAIREACAESDTHSYQTSDGFIIDRECLVTIKPEEGKWEGEVHTVTGMLVKSYGDWYLLSNEKNLDGSNPSDMQGYKYGWYVSGRDLKDQGVVLKTEMLSSVVGDVFKKDPLVRIAMALEDIATYLSRMSK